MYFSVTSSVESFADSSESVAVACLIESEILFSPLSMLSTLTVTLSPTDNLSAGTFTCSLAISET